MKKSPAILFGRTGGHVQLSDAQDLHAIVRSPPPIPFATLQRQRRRPIRRQVRQGHQPHYKLAQLHVGPRPFARFRRQPWLFKVFIRRLTHILNIRMRSHQCSRIRISDIRSARPLKRQVSTMNGEPFQRSPLFPNKISAFSTNTATWTTTTYPCIRFLRLKRVPSTHIHTHTHTRAQNVEITYYACTKHSGTAEIYKRVRVFKVVLYY